MIGGVQAVITAGVSTLPSITSRYSSLRRSFYFSDWDTMNSLRSEAFLEALLVLVVSFSFVDLVLQLGQWVIDYLECVSILQLY
jgi:hypothetical protein